MPVTVAVIMILGLGCRLHSGLFLCLKLLHNICIVDHLISWVTAVWTVTMNGLALVVSGSTVSAVMIGSTLEETMMAPMGSVPVHYSPIIIFHQLAGTGNCN